MPTTQKANTIQFKTTLYAIGDWVILRLPAEASKHLPSRGQVIVEGELNGIRFKTPLEPDGNFSHWFRPEASLLHSADANIGSMVTVSLAPIKDWPEPQIPTDLQKALQSSTQAKSLWQQITPMARWEWIRWTRSTSRSETRKRRVEVAISKLESGKRRPCCWNRNLCTEPAVSKNGLLLSPAS